jgi:hypothetical protein
MMVQLTALLFALLFQAKPFEDSWLAFFRVDPAAANCIDLIAGGLGSLLLIYGILLILGAAFTVRALATVYVLDARADLDNSAGGGTPTAPADELGRPGAPAIEDTTDLPAADDRSTSRQQFVEADGRRPH